MAKRGEGSSIPVAPHAPKPAVHHAPVKASHPAASGPAPKKPSSNGNSGGGAPKKSSGSTSKTTDPYAYAKAQQKKAEQKSSDRNLEQAHTIGLQVKALRLALGKKGFVHQLNQKLRNVSLVTRQADHDLMKGYHDRVESLDATASDNEKSAGAQTYANLANRSRERANAMNEAAAQGAGESDLLRSQGMALRNWNANQNEVNRSYFDTLTSINSSLTDLTTDTRTARVNNVAQANADRDQLWTHYHDQRSETLTNLGNTLGQQAEYFGAAKEAKTTKAATKGQKGAAGASGKAFTQASLEAGKAWKNPGVSKKLTGWEGADHYEAQMNNSVLASGAAEVAPKVPSGASLRKWEQ